MALFCVISANSGIASGRMRKSSRSLSHLLMSSCYTPCCMPPPNGSALHVVVANAPGAQFVATVYDDKVKQCGALWRIRGKFLTTCPSTALTSILPMLRAMGSIMKKTRQMTSSTKTEVHNVLHCCQKMMEPWPRITRIENFVFGRVVSEVRQRTDRHTDTLIATRRTRNTAK